MEFGGVMSGTISAGWLSTQSYQLSTQRAENSESVTFEVQGSDSKSDNVVWKAIKALMNRFFGLNQSRVQHDVNVLIEAKNDTDCLRAMKKLNESLKPASGVSVSYKIDYDENGQNPMTTYSLNIPNEESVELKKISTSKELRSNCNELIKANHRELIRRTQQHSVSESIKTALDSTMIKQSDTTHELDARALRLCDLLSRDGEKYHAMKKLEGDTYSVYVKCPDSKYS